MTRRRTLQALFCLNLLIGPATAALAQDLVIANARVFSAVDASVVDGVNLVIRGDRIESISAGPVKVSGADVIDGAGLTVMPGLIDAHLHLFFDLQGQARFPTSDAEAEGFVRDELPGDLTDYLQHGFTTVVSAIDFWPQIVEARGGLDSPDYAGPQLLVAGPVVVAPGDHYVCLALEGAPRAWCNSHVAIPAGSADEARASVARLAKSGVDLIVYDALTNAPEFDPAIAAAVVGAAHEAGLKVLVHNADSNRVAPLLEAGVDGFVHPPSGTRDASSGEWALIEPSSIPAGLPLGITIGETEEAIRAGQRTDEQKAAYEITRRNVQLMLEQGALPVFASDLPGAPPSRTLPIVLRSLTDLGLNNAQVLQTATRNAAQALDQDDIGTLEAGKRADILVLRGDPLADLAALNEVVLVIKSGRILVDNRGR